MIDIVDNIIHTINLLEKRKHQFLLDDSYSSLVHYLEGICTVLYFCKDHDSLTFSKWLYNETNGKFFTSLHWSRHMILHAEECGAFKVALDYFEKYLVYLKQSHSV